MTRIDRYVFRQTGLAFVVGLVGLTAVLWITQALRQIDLLTTKGQTLAVFLSLTALALPALLVVLTPVALFGGVIFALNRLSGDSELVSMSAAGLSPAQLLRPFAALAALALAATAYLTIEALPDSFIAFQRILTHMRADIIANLVRPGAFTELETGFVFHYREHAPDGSLHGIFIQDRRDPAHVTSYFAETGRTAERDGSSYLVLSKGTYQRPEAAGDSAFVTFDEYAIDLSQFLHQDNAARRPRERSTWELISPDPNDASVAPLAGRLRAELAERLTSPLYALTGMLIAFAALGRPRTTRQGRYLAVGGAILAFSSTRLLGVAMINWSAGAALGAVFAWVVPAATALFCLALVFGDLFRPGRQRLAAAPA